MRLDKFLAHNNFGTRKDVKQLIRQQRVTVNGMIVKDPGHILKEETDIVAVDDMSIDYSEFVYYMMNKPAGYECTHADGLYPSVIDLMDTMRNDLFFVGRLDVDTEGLLLITNDGKLAHRISHGKKEIYKQYYVELENPFDEQFIPILEAGMPFEESQLKPAFVEMITQQTLYLSIAEGKYHQVKRMMHYCKNEVIYLKRVKIGELELDELLDLGEYRELTDSEKAFFS